MLDVKLIREKPEFIKKNMEKRNNPENIQMLTNLIEIDKKWRIGLSKLNNLRHLRRVCTTEIATLKKAGKSAEEEVVKAKKLDEEITNLEKQVALNEEKTRMLLMRLPNILDENVPTGYDDKDNVVIKKSGTIPKFSFPIKNHIDLGLNLNIIDIERAGKVSGSRFFFLKGAGVLLDIALISYGIELLRKKGYELIEPPFLMKREPYEGVTTLDDFSDVLYKVENENLYLIATSEHPIAAMFMKEVFKEEDLPHKIAGVSTCFRKEAGSHGKDTRGIFRTHQFNKIEQFIFCKPEESGSLHEELAKNVEELLQNLEIPYRMVNVCTGDIGTVAAKKYDFEAWMPAQGEYREVVSCSNCTEYQARRLGIRYREKEGAPIKGYIHTLNSTAIATGRTIVAILENYQQEDGTIVVPKVLRKYMGNIEKITI